MQFRGGNDEYYACVGGAGTVWFVIVENDDIYAPMFNVSL